MKFLILVVLIAAASAAIVDDLIDCGSAGRVLDVKVEGCTGLPCHFKPDNVYESEIDFRTVQDSPVVHLVVAAVFGENFHTIIDEAVAVDIRGNMDYKLQYTLLITDLYFGDVSFAVQLVEKEVTHRIICVLAHCYIESN